MYSKSGSDSEFIEAWTVCSEQPSFKGNFNIQKWHIIVKYRDLLPGDFLVFSDECCLILSMPCIDDQLDSKSILTKLRSKMVHYTALYSTPGPSGEFLSNSVAFPHDSISSVVKIFRNGIKLQ